MFNYKKRIPNFFKSKVGIITGSSRGIGKTLAIELGKMGAKIVLNGRNLNRLEETKKELQLKGIDVIAVQGDITDKVDCERLINETLKEYKQLDFLVNNASLTMNESFETIDATAFNTVFVSNSIGAVMPTKAALPALKKSKGSVLFISSLAGLHGMPTASAYSAGKMALTGLWQTLKIECGHLGIHFGICYLGFTENDPDKRMLSAGGEWTKVPDRPRFIQKTQLQVAHILCKTIFKRKSKVILSPLGKGLGFIMRYFPTLSLSLMTVGHRKNRKK